MEQETCPSKQFDFCTGKKLSLVEVGGCSHAVPLEKGITYPKTRKNEQEICINNEYVYFTSVCHKLLTRKWCLLNKNGVLKR